MQPKDYGPVKVFSTVREGEDVRYWKERFIQSGKLGLSGSTVTDPLKDKEAEINRLKKLNGELTIANNSPKKASASS